MIHTARVIILAARTWQYARSHGRDLTIMEAYRWADSSYYG